MGKVFLFLMMKNNAIAAIIAATIKIKPFFFLEEDSIIKSPFKIILKIVCTKNKKLLKIIKKL